MQLGQTEAVGILNDHQGGIGNVHTHFNDGGGYQNISLTGSEGCHHCFLFRTLHLPVKQQYAQVRKYGFLQGFSPNLSGFDAQFFVFLHRRANHKALMSLGHLLAQEGVDAGAITFIYKEGIHRLPSGGQLVQNGHIQIAVHNQRQCPGDGGGGHHQHMGVAALGGQFGALCHTEAVLLIGNDHTQIRKNGSIRQQGMGSHRKIDLSGSDLLPYLPFFFFFHRARQQRNTQPQRGEDFAEGLIMLLCQDFRRRHQCRLMMIIGCQIGRCSGHHGFAAAHIALNQSIHGNAPAHISGNFGNGTFLRPGEIKGQRSKERLYIQICIRGGGFSGPGCPQQGKTCGEDEEFLKYQPSLGQLRLLHGGRLMNGIISPLCRQNTVLPPHCFRKDLLRHVTNGQRLIHRLENGSIGQSCRQGINGQYPSGGHRRCIQTLKGRVGHGIAGEISVDRTVEDVFLAVLQLVGDIAIIEEGHVQPGGMIRQLNLGHVQPLADMGGARGVHHHGFETGGTIRFQLADGHEPCAILVSPWEMADQIPEGEDIQIFKLLGLAGADALENRNGIR